MQVISVEQDTPGIVPPVTPGSGDWTGFTAQAGPFQFSAVGRLMRFVVTKPTQARRGRMDKPMVNRRSLRCVAGTRVECGDRAGPRGCADEPRAR